MFKVAQNIKLLFFWGIIKNTNSLNIKDCHIALKLFKKSDFSINKDFIKYISGSLYFCYVDICFLATFDVSKFGILFYMYQGFLYIDNGVGICYVVDFINILDFIFISFAFVLSHYIFWMCNKSTSSGVLVGQGS